MTFCRDGDDFKKQAMKAMMATFFTINAALDAAADEDAVLRTLFAIPYLRLYSATLLDTPHVLDK